MYASHMRVSVVAQFYFSDSNTLVNKESKRGKIIKDIKNCGVVFLLKKNKK